MALDFFTGPLTAVKISEWLSDCEQNFDAYDDANPSQKLTNKQKIQRAVASISRHHADSNKLHTWYNQNRRTLETKDWDSFRDSVKDFALGKGWRIKVLQDFYTYSQGSTKLDDYFQKFEALKFTVARSSNLSEIDAMVYKSHLLFGCRRDLVEKFLRTQRNDQQFINCDVEDIKSTLRYLDSEDSTTQSVPPPQPQQPVPPAPVQPSVQPTVPLVNKPDPVSFASTVKWDEAKKVRNGEDVHAQYDEAFQLMLDLDSVFKKFSLRVGNMMQHFNEYSTACLSATGPAGGDTAKLRLLLIRLKRLTNVLPYMVDIPYWKGDTTPNPNAFHYHLYWSHPNHGSPSSYAKAIWELWFPNVTYDGTGNYSGIKT